MAALPFTCTTPGTVTVVPASLNNSGFLRIQHPNGTVTWTAVPATGVTLTLIAGDVVVQRIWPNFSVFAVVTLGTAT